MAAGKGRMRRREKRERREKEVASVEMRLISRVMSSFIASRIFWFQVLLISFCLVFFFGPVSMRLVKLVTKMIIDTVVLLLFLFLYSFYLSFIRLQEHLRVRYRV